MVESRALVKRRSRTTGRHRIALWSAACLAMTFPADNASAQLGIKVDPAPLASTVTAPVNRSLNAMNAQVSRGLNRMTRQVDRGLGQVNRSVNRSLNRLNAPSYRVPVQPRTPSTYSYRPSSLANQAPTSRLSTYAPQAVQPNPIPQRSEQRLTKAQRVALQDHQERLAVSQAALGILAPEVLSKLSADQIGLQSAAQTAALEAKIGEIIEWTYDGVYGSAQALSETTLGTMRCRDFKQTIVVAGETQSAVGSACERGTGQWARSIF